MVGGSNKKIGDEPFIEIKQRSPSGVIWYYCRRAGIYVIAAAVCYGAYRGVIEIIGTFENKAKYEAQYEVYRYSLCDLLIAEGLTNRDCIIPFDRRIDPQFPKDVEKVLNDALGTYGIRAELNEAYAGMSAEDIFQKMTFHRIAPDGSAITGSEVPLTEVSLAVNKYLKQK